MSGAIDQLPSGSWRIRWRGLGGKRRAATFRDAATAREALRERLVEVDRARAGLAPVPVPEETLAALATRWLARGGPIPAPGVRPLGKRERRVREHQRILERHVLPALGHLRPSDVTEEVLRAFVRRLEATRTGRRGGTMRPSSVRNVTNTLRKMLRDHGRPTVLKVTVPIAAPVWLREPRDVATFLSHCTPVWFRVAAHLAVYAGLRRGEIAALRWADVDFARGVIVVRSSWDDDTTKGGDPRVVPLPEELEDVLLDWGRINGAKRQDKVVGVTRNQMERVSVHAHLAARRAGVTDVTFHQLRHTFASHLAERLPIRSVQELLGHSVITTTERYAHVSPWVVARDPRARLSFPRKPQGGQGRRRNRRVTRGSRGKR